MCTRDIRIRRISDTTRGRAKKIARIPGRNRNAFSYRASLPRSISVEIYRLPEPISLRFTGIQKSRSASRNSIGKWGNSTLRYEPTVHRASDQRTIKPKGIFTSGRMRATIGYSCGGFTFSLAAHRIMRFSLLSFLFFSLSFFLSRRSRIWLYWSGKIASRVCIRLVGEIPNKSPLKVRWDTYGKKKELYSYNVNICVANPPFIHVRRRQFLQYKIIR